MIVTDIINNSPFEIRTSRGDYQTNIKVALNWFKLANGNMVATDYTSAGDRYEAIINTYGTETYINNIITKLNNYIKSTQYCTLSGFASDEKIFGEHIDYTVPINALYIGYNRRKKTSQHGYGLEIGFKCSNPTFVSSTTFNFSGTSAIKYDYDADRNININNIDTYTGLDYSFNKDADSGSITYTVNLTSNEMIQLRNFQRTNRGSTFVLNSLAGITYPFGPRSNGPWNVKLININETRFGLNRFEATVTLQEVI